MNGASKRNEQAGELSQAELESITGGSGLPGIVATVTPTTTAAIITTQTSSNQDKDDWLAP